MFVVVPVCTPLVQSSRAIKERSTCRKFNVGGLNIFPTGRWLSTWKTLKEGKMQEQLVEKIFSAKRNAPLQFWEVCTECRIVHNLNQNYSNQSAKNFQANDRNDSSFTLQCCEYYLPQMSQKLSSDIRNRLDWIKTRWAQYQDIYC